MTNVLRKIIRQALIEMLKEARPEAQGATKGRGRAGTSSSFGGRRVYDKKTGEAYDVVDYQPRDPNEEVEKVTLKPRGKTGKQIKVSYDEFLGNYSRHVGQPVQTPLGSEPPNVAAWAWHELGKQGGKQKGKGDYSSGPMRGPGAVDVDPESGEFKRLPGNIPLEGDPTIGTTQSAEEEVAMDKISLVASNEPLYRKLVAPYIADYVESLKPSIVKAQRALKDYGGDMMRSGELDQDELDWFKTTPASEVFAAIWELPNFHEHILPSLGLPREHISSISSIVGKIGKLSIAALDEDDRVEEVVRTDPGFTVHLSRLKDDKFWNSLRKAAEQAGKYRGQF